MKFKVLIPTSAAFVVSSLILWGSISRAEAPARPHAGETSQAKKSQGLSCAQWEPRHAEAYLHSYANAAGDLERHWKSIAETLSGCRDEIAPGKRLACLGRLFHLASANASFLTPDHQMGLIMTDKQYYDSRPRDAVSLPAELSEKLPDDIQQLAMKNGWRVAEYRSLHATNPPNASYRRLLIQIPGGPDDRYMKFLQFTLPPDEQRWPGNPPERNLDVLAIDKSSGRAHYYQYWRTEGKFVDKVQAGVKRDRCYSCHLNATIHIDPQPGSTSEGDRAQLALMNADMAGLQKKSKNYGLDPLTEFHPALHGPYYGEEHSCIGCHGAEDMRNPIHGATNEGFLWSKMSALLAMPAPDEAEQSLLEVLRKADNLSDADRKILNRKIAKELKANAELPPGDKRQIDGGVLRSRYILKALQEKGHLSPEELLRWMSQLEDAYQKRQKLLGELRRTRLLSLRDWLTEESCLPAAKK